VHFESSESTSPWQVCNTSMRVAKTEIRRGTRKSAQMTKRNIRDREDVRIRQRNFKLACRIIDRSSAGNSLTTSKQTSDTSPTRSTSILRPLSSVSDSPIRLSTQFLRTQRHRNRYSPSQCLLPQLLPVQRSKFHPTLTLHPSSISQYQCFARLKAN